MDRFRRMEIFVAVVEAGQITRAAETLHLSKSAVSHGLADLERYLGLQLLARSPRSLQITESGQKYYNHCKRILTDIEDIEDQVRTEDKRISGNIRITAPDTFGSYVLTPIFAQFLEDNPAITLDLNLTEREVDLVEEGYDLAFRIALQARNNAAQKLSTIRMVICASPGYLKSNPPLKDHKDLKHHNCLKYTHSPSWNLLKDGRNFEISPSGTISTNSGENLRQFAIAGRGIIFVPYFMVYHAIQKGRLVEVLPDYEGRKIEGYIVRPDRTHCPARVQSLIDFTVQRVNEIEAALYNVA